SDEHSPVSVLSTVRQIVVACLFQLKPVEQSKSDWEGVIACLCTNLHYFTLSSIRNTVRPSRRSHSTLPPWASAACFATASPRPMPSSLPVTNGSNSFAAISGGGPGPVSVI